jgi:coenzyme F420 hydrogenase subunit beta
MRAIQTMQDVVDWGLCTGCGACYYACRKGGVSLVNINSTGIRPKFNEDQCTTCRECLSFCPGYAVNATPREALAGSSPIVAAPAHPSDPSPVDGGLEAGPSLEIWEGHATDRDLRHAASSGGALSALALYCLEQESMAFVLHTGMDQTTPWTNTTSQSRNRAELLARAGSRYAPASPCDGLHLIEESDRPCVFIGKPCDTAAVSALRKQHPRLDKNLGLTLTFFCAGTPSTAGTLDLLRQLHVRPGAIAEVQYRGQGWPGRFRVASANGAQHRSLSYEESWHRLEKYRPFRCHLCPDGLGQVADLSCGDAWHTYSAQADPGRSLILVRTARGRRILHNAVAAGYLELQRSTGTAVQVAQTALIKKRAHLYGRLLAMRMLLVPAPRFPGFSLFESWSKLPLSTKLRTIVGTLKRLCQKRLWRRHPC